VEEPAETDDTSVADTLLAAGLVGTGEEPPAGGTADTGGAR
jgi:maltose alpha-D-glucosyltransferase / alpha-amylase